MKRCLRVLLAAALVALEACGGCGVGLGGLDGMDIDIDLGGPGGLDFGDGFGDCFDLDCGGANGETYSLPELVVTPQYATLEPGASLAFELRVVPPTQAKITWSVDAGCGTVTQDGVYTAPLTTGTYTVFARSDLRGVNWARATVVVTDATAPDTRLLSGPALTGATAAVLTFDAAGETALDRFECRLDDAPWAVCRSPVTYATLATDAAHRFEARAVDRAGNADPSPAAWTWITGRLHALGLSGGGDSTCARVAAGGLVCWGANAWGQLGDGTHTSRAWPAPVPGFAAGASAVAAGDVNTCALNSNGGALCWGNDYSGTRYLSWPWSGPSPVTVAGLTAGLAGVSMGGDVACARTAAGGVLCWGMLWDAAAGRWAPRFPPESMSGAYTGVADVETGDHLACLRTETGGVKCWGEDTYGGLGDGDTVNRDYFTGVVGLASGALAVAVGYRHACAVTAAGGVVCWGMGESGQLGNGGHASTNLPVTVAGLPPDIVAVSAGAFHTCALSAAGGVWCWGAAALGSALLYARSPVAVPGLATGVVQIAAGYMHNCAVLSDGGVRCWGSNYAGQVGLGPLPSQPSEVTAPAAVAGFR